MRLILNWSLPHACWKEFSAPQQEKGGWIEAEFLPHACWKEFSAPRPKVAGLRLCLCQSQGCFLDQIDLAMIACRHPPHLTGGRARLLRRGPGQV